MMTQQRHRPIRSRQLFAYLEDEVTGSERQAIEAQLERSETLREQLGQARAILDDSRRPERVEALDLVPLLHAEIQAPRRATPHREPDASRRRLVWPWTVALASAGLAAVVVFALVPLDATQPSGDDELRVKAAAPAADQAKPWVRLEVYRVRAGGDPERIHDRLRTDDGLLFAYANPGPQPYSYLLVFAVDGSGKVYWFYPPHLKTGANPSAVPIRRSRLGTELPDLVKHDFGPGPLVIYGVFTANPVDVAKVESTVAALVRARTWNVASPPRLPLAKTVQRTVEVTVHGRDQADDTD